jgi:hypothetical protein
LFARCVVPPIVIWPAFSFSSTVKYTVAASTVTA